MVSRRGQSVLQMSITRARINPDRAMDYLRLFLELDDWYLYWPSHIDLCRTCAETSTAILGSPELIQRKTGGGERSRLSLTSLLLLIQTEKRGILRKAASDLFLNLCRPSLASEEVKIFMSLSSALNYYGFYPLFFINRTGGLCGFLHQKLALKIHSILNPL